MLLDALVAFIIIKMFELEGLKVLAAVTMVAVLRTCHNVNSIISMELEEIIKNEEEN